MLDSLDALLIVAIGFSISYAIVDRAQRYCNRQHWNQKQTRDHRHRREADRRQKALEYANRSVETLEPAKRDFFAQRAVYWNTVATEWASHAKESDRQVRWWNFLR